MVEVLEKMDCFFLEFLNRLWQFDRLHMYVTLSNFQLVYLEFFHQHYNPFFLLLFCAFL